MLLKKEVITTSLFDYIFKKPKHKEIATSDINNYFELLDGYSPAFTTYDGGVYEMDLTRTAIHSFATHCAKLKPEIQGTAYKHLEKILQFKPNRLMDTYKFIYKIATILECEHTAFIVPLYNKDYYLIGWYPIRPALCEILDISGEAWLRYTFGNGNRAAIELSQVGIMTINQYKNDIFGEQNNTLEPTMQLIHSSNESIVNAVKNSANIRFVARIANMIKDEDIRKERDRWTEENLSSKNKSGMLLYDNKFADLKQVESKPYTPNALQIQQIQENVCTHFGTNMDILQNKFNEDTWNAYYEGKIEPFAIQLSLVMSNMTYTTRELSCGNSIVFSANRLQYASNNTKLQVSTQLLDRGILSRNNVMDIWNLPHVEGGDKYYIRKEYTEVSNLDNLNENISNKSKEESNGDKDNKPQKQIANTEQ